MEYICSGTREMIWWSRVFGVPPQDLRLVLSTHMVTQPCVTPVMRDLIPSSGIHETCKHTWTHVPAGKACIHIKFYIYINIYIKVYTIETKFINNPESLLLCMFMILINISQYWSTSSYFPWMVKIKQAVCNCFQSSPQSWVNKKS